MAELFGVTLDSLLTEDHAVSAPPAPAAPSAQAHTDPDPSQSNTDADADGEGRIVFAMDPPPVVNHWAIDAVTFVGIWLAGALAYLIGWFCRVDLSAILVAAWPVSLLVMLIFNSLWGKPFRTFWYCAGFVIGLLFFLCWVLRAYAIWKLMWLSLPAAAIVWFSCRIHRR